MSSDNERIAGAANSTTGSIIVQEVSQDSSQCWTKSPIESTGRLAIAAATEEVRPD
jgi:hypothetical protein